MLDKNIKVTKEEAKTYPPLPENIYQVQLLDVTSKENETYDSKRDSSTETEYETVMSFQFTLLAGQDLMGVNGVEDLRGRNVWANFIPIYLYIGKNGKNNLYRIIEALLGRDITPEEEAGGIDGEFLNKLIGKQCRIGTKHKKSGDKVFDNIETYYPSETDGKALTDEEVENATVKVKEESKEDLPKNEPQTVEEIEYPSDEPNPEDIPF